MTLGDSEILNHTVNEDGKLVFRYEGQVIESEPLTARPDLSTMTRWCDIVRSRTSVDGKHRMEELAAKRKRNRESPLPPEPAPEPLNPAVEKADDPVAYAIQQREAYQADTIRLSQEIEELEKELKEANQLLEKWKLIESHLAPEFVDSMTNKSASDAEEQ